LSWSWRREPGEEERTKIAGKIKIDKVYTLVYTLIGGDEDDQDDNFKRTQAKIAEGHR